jgi:TnpA family transposase
MRRLRGVALIAGLGLCVHPRHFGYYDWAVSIYSHVSDRLGVYGTLVISCAPRALWGLCHLLGIDFMPRLKDLADQRL